MADEPTWGWKGRRSNAPTAFVNPHAPSVPATLEINLEQYYAGCGAIGIFAAQAEEPNSDWVVEKSREFGRKMARSYETESANVEEKGSEP